LGVFVPPLYSFPPPPGGERKERRKKEGREEKTREDAPRSSILTHSISRKKKKREEGKEGLLLFMDQERSPPIPPSFHSKGGKRGEEKSWYRSPSSLFPLPNREGGGGGRGKKKMKLGRADPLSLIPSLRKGGKRKRGKTPRPGQFFPYFLPLWGRKGREVEGSALRLLSISLSRGRERKGGEENKT